MYGPPSDVEGECNARLYIRDDFGDNHATMRCQLPEGHEGKHQEKYDHNHNDGEVVIQWGRNDDTNDDTKLHRECGLSVGDLIQRRPCGRVCEVKAINNTRVKVQDNGSAYWVTWLTLNIAWKRMNEP